MNDRMIVKYSDGSEMEIKLLDTPYVRYFCENWKRLEDFPLKQTCSAYDLCTTTAYFCTPEERDEKIKEYGDKLNSIFEEIRDTWDVDFPLWVHPDMSSEELNFIHRCFVTATLTLSDRGFTWKFPKSTLEELIKVKTSRLSWNNHVCKETGTVETRQDWRNWSLGHTNVRWKGHGNGMDGTGWVFDKTPECETINNIKWEKDGGHMHFVDLLHGINHYVHLYENAHKVTENSAIGREITNGRKIVRVMRDFYSHGKDCHKNVDTMNEFWDEFREDCSFDDHDVWLSKDILGRDYHDAWMHHDDPTNQDVCNVCIRHSPNIMIDQDNSFNDLMTSQPLRDYYNEYGIPFEEKILANVPIGNIVNGWKIADHSGQWPNPQAVEWTLH